MGLEKWGLSKYSRRTKIKFSNLMQLLLSGQKLRQARYCFVENPQPTKFSYYFASKYRFDRKGAANLVALVLRIWEIATSNLCPERGSPE
jgi:hypothetical protein